MEHFHWRQKYDSLTRTSEKKIYFLFRRVSLKLFSFHWIGFLFNFRRFIGGSIPILGLISIRTSKGRYRLWLLTQLHLTMIGDVIASDHDYWRYYIKQWLMAELGQTMITKAITRLLVWLNRTTITGAIAFNYDYWCNRIEPRLLVNCIKPRLVVNCSEPHLVVQIYQTMRQLYSIVITGTRAFIVISGTILSNYECWTGCF